MMRADTSEASGHDEPTRIACEIDDLAGDGALSEEITGYADRSLCDPQYPPMLGS